MATPASGQRMPPPQLESGFFVIELHLTPAAHRMAMVAPSFRDEFFIKAVSVNVLMAACTLLFQSGKSPNIPGLMAKAAGGGQVRPAKRKGGTVMTFGGVSGFFKAFG